MSDVIKIVLADDHAVVRKGLRLLLDGEDGFEVVAEAGTADDAMRFVRAHRPAVLVLDLNMPGKLTSLDAIPEVGAAGDGTRVVVLTMQEDPEFARQALGNGAAGYVLKEAADDELVEAVRRAAAGDTYLNPRLGAALAAAPPKPSGLPDDLTEREVEILRLVAQGLTDAQVAERLVISPRTVQGHLRSIYSKLDVTSRTAATRFAIEQQRL